MQIPNDPLSIPWADHLTDTGTLIVWEKLDKFTEKAGEAVIDVATFNEQLDFARSHLELVFHRYLSGESGLTRVRMSLNGNQLIPLDPFNPGHPATIVGPVETILVSGHPVVIQTFRLPQRSEISPSRYHMQHFCIMQQPLCLNVLKVTPVHPKSTSDKKQPRHVPVPTQ